MSRKIRTDYSRKNALYVAKLVRKFNGRTVYDCYNRVSATKKQAFNECMDIVNSYENNGYIVLCYAVVNYNSHHFTFAFIERVDDDCYDYFIHILTKDSHYIKYIGGII